ncbi:MAG: Asp-tRNA(Asn)/Glu-tRNA(Gln) amidotransferase subunit GatB [archaeon]
MVKIGLEIHGYISTKEKLFCRCKSEHGVKFFKPNTNICPICTGQPGSKPLFPNKKAIDKAVEISLILNCRINSRLIWQRKHYDWPDLPKGYQNTLSGSYATPVGENGKFLGIKIKEAHLEEDPAAWNPKTGEIDYNRSGSPLIEIVTEPDFKDSEQVAEWIKKLITTLGYIKAIDKNVGIKADVNISTTGERVEIKNINSIKNIKTAINYEIKRQSSKENVPKKQETRRFDEAKKITVKMREKEQAEDYRFISDPDLPVINLEKSRIEKLKKQIPETPQEKLNKLIKKHKVDKKSAEALIKRLELVDFFEAVTKKISPKTAVPWITKELFSVLNYNKKELEEVEINAEHFAELLSLIEDKTITELKAQEILRQFIPKSFSPKSYAEKNLIISSEEEIKKLAQKIIKEYPKAVEDFKSGKKESLNFLIGQIMKISSKRADFRTAKKILEDELK